jgi:hypothetical protein
VSAGALSTGGTAPAAGQVLGYTAQGLRWVNGASAGGAWLLNGNAQAFGFLGTTDNNSLHFRINNQFFMSLDPSGDLFLRQVEGSDVNLDFATANGLGVYGTNLVNGQSVGRNFAGLDINGPVLFGQSGGGLGVVAQKLVDNGGGQEAQPDQRAVLTWQWPGGDGATIHVGGRGANGDPKLIRFGDGTFVHIGENGADDTLEFKAAKFAFRTADFLVVDGRAGQQAYLGANADNDVEFGSMNPGVEIVAFYNQGSQRYLDARMRDANIYGNAVVDGSLQVKTVLVVDGLTQLNNSLTVAGTTTTGVLTIRGGADVAEPFAITGEDDVPKGSVVVIDENRPGHLRQSTEEYDTRVAGIVSGANGINPGLSLSQPGVNDEADGQQVSLSGRVYCLVDADAGPVRPGDLLTTSRTPGHAQKVTDHTRSQGAVLGKAMSALESGKGYVLVLVTLQ